MSSSDWNAEDITGNDLHAYNLLISSRLSREQQKLICTPPRIFPEQNAVLGVHFHPEHIPLTLISQRIRAMFPNSAEQLIIPTQHNTLMVCGEHAGVEVDCRADEFNRKVQLLLHFRADRMGRASALKDMLAHTFRYRSEQLLALAHTFTRSAHEDRLVRAAAETGAEAETMACARAAARKFEMLFHRAESGTPPEMIKNKLFRDYVDSLRPLFGSRRIDHVQILIRAAKNIMKAEFPLSYFYRVQEIIEEARTLGGCIIVPHPEQFWPILLAGYDVDGYEVWNPQSREYTEFLIDVVHRQNAVRAGRQRKILIMMGDDTHFSEKLRDPACQEPDKALREVGVQPAWDDPAVQKRLREHRIGRIRVITQYRQRLSA